MNTDKVIRTLTRIKERYFRKTIAQPGGDLVHHGHCSTHRSMEVYKYAPCTCGLLHDMLVLDNSLAVKLLPSLHEDEARQEAMPPGSRYWTGPPSEEEIKESMSFLEKIFGKPVKLTKEEIREIDDRDWSLIEQVFGVEFRDRRKQQYRGSELSAE